MPMRGTPGEHDECRTVTYAWPSFSDDRRYVGAGSFLAGCEFIVSGSALLEPTVKRKAVRNG
jgi:hypothetical protein